MIGYKIRQVREEQQILLRELAAKLDMDTALLSKMERGERCFKKEDMYKIAKVLKQPKQELLTLWLADKILKTIQHQDNKTQALELALTTLK